MPAEKFTWDDMPAEQVTDTFSRKMVVGKNEMLRWLELKPGCKVPEHSHENEQISHVLKGRLRFVVDGETIEVGPGEILLIPPPRGALGRGPGRGDRPRLRYFQPDPLRLAGRVGRLSEEIKFWSGTPGREVRGKP